MFRSGERILPTHLNDLCSRLTDLNPAALCNQTRTAGLDANGAKREVGSRGGDGGSASKC